MSETAMSDAEASSDEGTGDEGPDPVERVEDLRAQVDLLRTENERLRTEYSRARQASYRQTALGLGAVGVVAVLGGLLFPAVRDVLFVLGAIGVFGAVLTRYLTPERFVAAETGERVYAAQAESIGGLTGQLGLEETHVYVPVEGDPPARLFVPQHREYSIPEEDALDYPLVVGERGDERGASFVPTGGTLFREFERSLTGALGTDAATVADQVGDALVEGFELARTADVSIDAGGGRATLELAEPVYADANAPDNPLGSLLAVALAEALATPVRLETARTGAGLVVTCRWDAEDAESAEVSQPESAAGEPRSEPVESDAETEVEAETESETDAESDT